MFALKRNETSEGTRKLTQRLAKFILDLPEAFITFHKVVCLDLLPHLGS